MTNKYFWLLDEEAQEQFKFHLHPGQENLGDYPSKAHTGAIHRHVRSFYIHMNDSPTELSRAAPPSSWRGCAETLANPYYRRVPLPKISRYRKLDMEANISPCAHFASPIRKLCTQTPNLANIGNSRTSTENVHRSTVPRLRYVTLFPNYATSSYLRYLHDPYCTHW